MTDKVRDLGCEPDEYVDYMIAKGIAEELNADLMCQACTGTGFEPTDPEDASPCLDCNGSGLDT